MRAYEVGSSDYEHYFRWKVLEYVVDGIEVGQVLFSELLPLSLGDVVSEFFVAVGRTIKEDQR